MMELSKQSGYVIECTGFGKDGVLYNTGFYNDGRYYENAVNATLYDTKRDAMATQAMLEEIPYIFAMKFKICKMVRNIEIRVEEVVE